MEHHEQDPAASVFSLTQIRHLMRVEFSRAQRYGYPVSCMVCGIDRLDNLRDLYGYEFRERVLVDVVDLLQNATRTCDYLGRLVDDRLMAILPHTTRAGAEVTARRLIAAARTLAFEAEGHGVVITLSSGISHFENENTMFFDSLVEAAEIGLAEATQEGGDRFVYRSPGPLVGNPSAPSSSGHH
ncbi:MAG: hypothetical protein CMJ89_07845 [Planctomycetes bacterium]|nr:hypothetical protein [Planctomycetota bacterium]